MGNLTNYLLIAIGLAFLAQMFTGLDNGIVTSLFLFVPSLAFSEPWRFLTSMFLHGGIMHIFFNAYALILFGSILERRVSRKEFLAIYFIGGLAGGLAYLSTYYLGIIPNIPALGASGAIYAVLGAVAVLMPDMRIFVWFIPMSMRQAAIFWVVIELLNSFNIGSGIASAAHLGGLLIGIAIAFMIKKRKESLVYPVASGHDDRFQSRDYW